MKQMKFYSAAGECLTIHITESHDELRGGNQKSYTQNQARQIAAAKGFFNPSYVPEARAFKKLFLANRKPGQPARFITEISDVTSRANQGEDNQVGPDVDGTESRNGELATTDSYESDPRPQLSADTESGGSGSGCQRTEQENTSDNRSSDVQSIVSET